MLEPNHSLDLSYIYFLKTEVNYCQKRLAYEPRKGTIVFMESIDFRTIEILDKFKFETSKQYVQNAEYMKEYLNTNFREKPFSIEEMREHYAQRLKEGWTKAGETFYNIAAKEAPMKSEPLNKDYEHGFTDT